MMQEAMDLLHRIDQAYEEDQPDEVVHLLEDQLAALEPLQPNQDEFVKILNLANDLAWDIPSALLMFCDHDRPWEEEGWAEFPMHREPQPYWDGKNPWPQIDSHFKDQHGLDLDDYRIDWHFDT